MATGDTTAKRIEQLLDEKGWSQGQLARAIDVSQQTIWKLVSGQSQSSRYIRQIADKLGVTPEYLLLETDERGAATVADRRLPYHGEAAARDDDVEIEQVDLRYGMGGTFVDEHVEVERKTFSRAWLRQFTDAAPANLFWARGQGNSMEPTIGDGEVVLIDRGQAQVSFGDNVYAFAYGQVGMIKRLRPLPDGSVEIHSDNPNINLPPARAVDDEVHVIGRVVAVVKRI